MNELHNAPAVVITGASSGIGREIARLAAADGCALLLVGRSQPALQELAQELGALGVPVHVLSIDLQVENALAQIQALLSAQRLYCDVLVNSAGFGIFGTVAEADSSLQLQLVDVNIKAVVALTLGFLPGMIARGRGGIINIGSITGYAPGPHMACYCASKAFIRSFSSALSAEVSGTGVTVTCLTAGVVRTAFFERKPMRESRLTKILPRGNVGHAARVAWSAFKSGQSFVVPRFIDRSIIRLCWLIPDRILARLVQALQRAP